MIAHMMGGSYQLAGRLFNAQVAGTPLLVIAADLLNREGLGAEIGEAACPILMFGASYHFGKQMV